MLILLLICLLVGAVLGQRFKVLVLVPAMALTFTAAAVLANAGTILQILGAALVATTGVQIGYLAGVGTRYLTAAARTNLMPRASLTDRSSPQHAANQVKLTA